MSLNRLWVFLAVALPVLASVIANLSSVDLTYHLRAGDEILSSGAIPRVDTWTYTAAGVPWVDQQWGAQVVLEAAYRFAGWTGLVLLRGLLVGIIFGSVFAIARWRGLSERTSALLTLAAFAVSAVALAMRPQLIGMAIFAVVLLLVVDRRAHPRRLWLVPVIVAIWANMHGSFFLGPVLLGLAWLEDVHDHDPGARRVLALAAISAAAACINPFGPAVWGYAIGLSTNPLVTQRISEWAPTTLRTIPGILFFASAAAIVVLIARRGDRTAWPTLAWLGVFFVIGAFAIRGVAWWPLAAVAAIAGTLVVDRPRTAEARPDPPLIRRANLAIAVILVVVGIALLPVWRPIEPGLQAPVGVVGNAPPGITDALRTRAVPGDRLFAPQPWGSWFEFSLPALPIGIDSRIELFPVSVWDDYELVVSGADGWQERLRTWGVTLAVVAGDDQAAFGDRLRAAGWRPVYHDDDGTLLTAPDRPGA